MFAILLPMKQRGFTVIELLAAIVVLVTIGAVFFIQKANLESASRDDMRRTAINAMYYNLEDVFFAKNKYYPQIVDEKNLTAMDKALFKDPNGHKIGSGESDYRYEPTNCSLNGKCKGYSLRAQLENEADYIKSNR
jgi:prepilin-type N-terminal cleavage/methylation domain-containing protein